MEYLHTMVRVKNLKESLDFYINKLGMTETRRIENEKGQFTLVFLAASHDLERATQTKAPLIELTYNWPQAGSKEEAYTVGRNFGHLAFRVENIYETCQSLMNKGVVIHRPPRDGHIAFIQSPDNISIELIQQGEKLSPQSPWQDMPNKGTW